MNTLGILYGRLKGLRRRQRGITGLETAIVLIAFVVVASVFAFAVLSTGLLSSQTAKETVTGGLGETATILAIKGSVVGRAPGATVLERIVIPIGTAPGTTQTVDLTTSTLQVTYIDADDVANIAWNGAADQAGAFLGWELDWLQSTGDLLDSTEQIQLIVNINDGGTLITTQPGASAVFTLQIKPATGKVLEITRTLPTEMTAVVNLD